MSNLALAFGLVAIVLTLAALGSALVERAPLSFPMIFLGIGVLLYAAGIVRIGPEDELLRIIAVLDLSFVLFLDAVNLRFDEISRNWAVPVLTLGPGTLLVIGIVSIAAHFLVQTTWLQSLLIGAVLASTDPVVTRDIIRDERVPRAIRGTLSIEAGTNDVVVLPILLVLLVIAGEGGKSAGGWITFAAQIFVLGPLVGAAVGYVGSWLMAGVTSRVAVRREYQSLYGVGLVLASYAAGETVGGDGFLSAFAAGVAVSVSNYELCECFLEFGEVAAEMAMLLAFILFGVVLAGLTGTIAILPAALLGVVAIIFARPFAIGLVLRNVRISRRARLFLGWFGPRGLSSLLFALLIVERGITGASKLLAIAGVVVGLSVVAHGVTATPLAAAYGKATARRTASEERESEAAGLFQGGADEVPRITPNELAQQLQSPDSPIVLDVRTRSSYLNDSVQIPGSVRVLPDQVVEWAAKQDRKRSVVAYCT